MSLKHLVLFCRHYCIVKQCTEYINLSSMKWKVQIRHKLSFSPLLYGRNIMLMAPSLELAPVSCQLTEATLLPAKYMYREESQRETIKVAILAIVS
jgi:hypothetical protein